MRKYFFRHLVADMCLMFIWINTSYADTQFVPQTIKISTLEYGPKRTQLMNGNIVEIRTESRVGKDWSNGNGIKEVVRLKRTDDGEVRSGFSFDCSWSHMNQAPCYSVALASGKFLIVDCIMHDSTLYSCRLLRFLQNGDKDISFHPVLGWKGDEWSGENSKDDIVGFSEITALADDQLRLKGYFSSALLNPSSVEAEVILKSDGSIASSKVIRTVNLTPEGH